MVLDECQCTCLIFVGKLKYILLTVTMSRCVHSFICYIFLSCSGFQGKWVHLSDHIKDGVHHESF